MFSANIIAQEIKNENNEQSQKTENSTINKTSSEETPNKVELIDENKNGIDDRIENKKQNETSGNARMRKRSGEHFMDEDGDGINDNRCKGMGIGKGKGKKAGKRK